ncbi:MAG: N-acetyltransferase [Bacteroidales bacterium]|nr:N-acetyltransferase [Bacteroidales bacterium]
MIEIRKIEGRRQLNRFVQFAIDLYKGNENYVPPIISMEVDTLDPAKNPVYQFCESIFFLAFCDGKPVGRVAGFINHRSNEKLGEKIVRFCWIDFVDDHKVSSALLDSIRSWGKQRGMDTMIGPMGPSDIDNEGCLVEGFDFLPTSLNSYNASYYKSHFESYGMITDATWYEFLIEVPERIPEKFVKVAAIVKERYGLKVFFEPNAKRAKKEWGQKLFELLNVCYSQIYGFTEMTPKQIDYYVNLYLPQVPMDLIRFVTDCHNDLIAFGIMIPSLSKAQQKAKGHLFPFGWYHLLSAMRKNSGNDTVDMLLIGVRPDYQNKGVHSLIFTDMYPTLKAYGFRYMETNCELETNHKIQQIWKELNPLHHKTRMAYRISI